MGFFLGKDVTTSAPVDYAPKHLTTHGLIFGMTGSGKTGLALGILEEAQRAKIPIIAIDPKGDLGNLALCWPDLSPRNFAPWIDPARLDGQSPLDAAEPLAETWKAGLAKDGLGPEQIAEMRKNAHIAIYTPGSTAGIPVSILDKFEPPTGYAALPEEDKSELVGGVVAALLALVKVSADPLQSREFILVSNILREAWKTGRSLDLPQLVQQVSEPPFSKLGVFELDEFFPPKRRRDFAMQLNGLIASPSFEAWREGVPLDVDRLLRKEPNGSRTSIFSIAHLDDTERMSFVTLLLDRVIAWMRAQPGTGELRGILYMDEVFGYLPPHPANPPTKRPILTLLKQARAFGLGVLLATQNPVDVDYKSLTNAGTWMIGKLQTDQDKERILDGLMSAQTTDTKVSRSEVSRQISALEGRQFVLQNAHTPDQITFKTRFCMSYLRGPLTRQEISRLRDADFYNAPEVASLAPPKAALPTPPVSGSTASATTHPPVVGEVVPRPGSFGPSIVDASRAGVDDVVEPSGSAPRSGWVSPPASSPYAAPQAPQSPSAGWPTSPSAPSAPSAPAGRPDPSRSADPNPITIRHLDTLYLLPQLLSRPAVRADAMSGPATSAGPQILRAALFATARMELRVEGWMRLGAGPGNLAVDLGETAYVAFPLPDAPGGIHWRPLTGFALGELSLAAPPGYDHLPIPYWCHSPADRERAKELLVRQVATQRTVTVPVCPPLLRHGEPGESVDSFRRRLASQVNLASNSVIGKLEGQRDLQAAHFDKKLAEMKALLEMDKNELAMLKSLGDTEGYKKAQDRARFRLEKYKELQGSREKFVGLAQRDVTDVEFSALDKIEAIELRDVRLDARHIATGRLGLLWLPNR